MNTYTFQVRGTPHAEGLRLDNLCAVVDLNGLQIDGPARKIIHRFGGSVTIRLTGITRKENHANGTG